MARSHCASPRPAPLGPTRTRRASALRDSLIKRLSGERQIPVLRAMRYSTFGRSGPSGTVGSSKSSAGSRVMPIRRITACERRLATVVTARISEHPRARERHVVVQLVQAREADELARGPYLNRPPSVASLVELGLELCHAGIALLAGKQVAQVLPDLGIGIHRRPRCEVGVTPSTEGEAIGTQFGHAAQPTCAPASEQTPFPRATPPHRKDMHGSQNGHALLGTGLTEATTDPAHGCGHSTRKARKSFSGGRRGAGAGRCVPVFRRGRSRCRRAVR